MKHISEWFVSFEGAHGTFVPGKKDAKGKTEGFAQTVRGKPITRAMWDAHVEGTGPGVGAIALLEDDTVRWGACDIDKYSIDLNALSIKLKDTPLVVCRTKSGGAHLYCFVREPVPATAMVEYLTAVAARLGHGGCEIFPKQTSRAPGSVDVGNWLNMPYYKGGLQRHAIHEGRALSLDEFLALIETKAVMPEDFGSFEGIEDEAPQADAPKDKPRQRRRAMAEPTGERFSDGPPCLQHIAENGGFGSGVRNEGMFSVGVYVKKKHEDDWKDQLLNYRDMCDPPMDAGEIDKTVIKSLARKDYGYKCTVAPLAPFCNRALCLKRAYGVGQTVDGASFGSLTKYEGSPVTWVIEIEGRRLELSTEELQNQQAFARKCAEVLTKYPKQVPAARWHEFLSEQIERAAVVPASNDEETVEGHFWVLLERFCTQRSVGNSRDDVMQNYPWTEDGFHWFRGVALVEYLNKQQFKFKNNRELKRMMTDGGGKSTTWTLRNGDVNVWGVPEFRTAADEHKPLPEGLTEGTGDEF